MDVGENLKFFRKQKGLTQKQLSELIDKSESTIVKYEGNSVYPDIPTLREISDVLQVNILDLIQDEGILSNSNQGIISTKIIVNEIIVFSHLPGKVESIRCTEYKIMPINGNMAYVEAISNGKTLSIIPWNRVKQINILNNESEEK